MKWEDSRPKSFEEELKAVEGVSEALKKERKPYHAQNHVDRNVKRLIRMQEWKKEAEKFYFVHHLKMGEIAELTGISRQSISGHLKRCPGYGKETEYRKAVNRIRRREYKTQKQRAYREEASVAMQVTGESLRREHDIAAVILSREKYY